MFPKYHHTRAKEATISSALEMLPTPNSELAVVEVYDILGSDIYFHGFQKKNLSF